MPKDQAICPPPVAASNTVLLHYPAARDFPPLTHLTIATVFPIQLVHQLLIPVPLLALEARRTRQLPLHHGKARCRAAAAAATARHTILDAEDRVRPRRNRRQRALRLDLHAEAAIGAARRRLRFELRLWRGLQERRLGLRGLRRRWQLRFELGGFDGARTCGWTVLALGCLDVQPVALLDARETLDDGVGFGACLCCVGANVDLVGGC